jgi:hypothetical protein
MAEPVLLSFEKHGKLRLSDSSDFTQFKSQHLVPVVLQELYALATEFPIVFVRNGETGDFVPVAMMGLSKGKNLYCQKPSWPAAFTPTAFTLAPLSVKELGAGEDDFVMAIDEESPLLSDSVGAPLFEANGDLTEYLQTRIKHVVTVTRQSLQAAALCQFMVDKNLFHTRLLTLQRSENSPRYEVEGVYSIDEDVLEKLSDADYMELRGRGLISIIYSHLTSLHQFERLLRLQNQADKEQADSMSWPDQEQGQS